MDGGPALDGAASGHDGCICGGTATCRGRGDRNWFGMDGGYCGLHAARDPAAEFIGKTGFDDRNVGKLASSDGGAKNDGRGRGNGGPTPAVLVCNRFGTEAEVNGG